MTVGNYTLPTEIMRTCSEGTMWCFANWAYGVTSGLFWVAMLAAFAVVIYISTMRLGNARAFGFASFVGMIGAVWFAMMSLMSWEIASAFIIIGAIGLAVMLISKGQ